MLAYPLCFYGGSSAARLGGRATLGIMYHLKWSLCLNFKNNFKFDLVTADHLLHTQSQVYVAAQSSRGGKET